MGAPKADQAKCDVFGCGHLATIGTDGSEKDIQGLGRKALPSLNVCESHSNWPHSDDARLFAAGDVYRKRVPAPKGP
jgi:hypothetical protein